MGPAGYRGSGASYRLPLSKKGYVRGSITFSILGFKDQGSWPFLTLHGAVSLPFKTVLAKLPPPLWVSDDCKRRISEIEASVGHAVARWIANSPFLYKV